jgi:hypothetical protein
MKYREPECHAQQINDKLFDATGSLTRIAQDVRVIARAMMDLGLGAGEDLWRMSEEIAANAREAAGAHGEYVHRLADGTLYSALSSPHGGSL